MNSRHDIISSNESDNDDQITPPPPYSRSSGQHYNHSLLNAADDPIGYKNRETQPLLDEGRVETSSGVCCPARYIIAVWAFLGFFCVYAMRVNLSVAIVAMVAPQSSLNKSVEACPVEKTNSSKPPEHYDFDWDPSIEGYVLGAFFYGYIFTQVIGGYLAEQFGAKWVFGGCVLITGILTLLTPLAAHTDYRLLIGLRVLMGMASGPAFPSAAVLWGKWIPPAERSTVPPAAQTGTSMGIIFTTPLTSIMIGAGFLGGWPSAFYVFGVLSCLWFVMWCYFGYSSPDTHPRISERERLFLKQTVPQRSAKNRATPWRKIATCGPLYGISIMHVCYNFIYYTLLTTLPTYFATILKFDLHENGFLFALPYVVQLLTTLAVGRTVDYLRVRKIFSVTTLRKSQAVIGMIGTCAFLISIGYMGCNHIGAVTCCVFAVGFLGFQTCGPIISHLDVASNYAGILVGITNALATIPGFVGPYVVGAITNNHQTVASWRLIFEISAGIGAFGTVAYCILFNGEEQPWNRIQEEQTYDRIDEENERDTA
jgi:ACS family sodium-dependent inorganic phosphate cotransporter-like MFS transporter 5